MITDFRTLIRRQILALATLPLFWIAGMQSAAAYSVPAGLGVAPGVSGSVPAPGYPNFNNGADLTFSKLANGTYQLKSTQSGSNFTFNTDNSAAHSWAVSNGTFKLTANFTGSLAFNSSGSSVDIFGKIPAYAGPGNAGTVKTTPQNLLHANLTGFGFDILPVGLGFTTAKSGLTGWARQFQSGNESVWFYSSNIWQTILHDIALNANKKTWTISMDNLQAVTTVPIPAAVWLFGSALVALFGTRRKTLANAGGTLHA